MSSNLNRVMVRQVVNSLIRKWSSRIARIWNPKRVLLIHRPINIFLDILMYVIRFQAAEMNLCIEFQLCSSIANILKFSFTTFPKLLFTLCSLPVWRRMAWSSFHKLTNLAHKKVTFSFSHESSQKTTFSPRKSDFLEGGVYHLNFSQKNKGALICLF